MTSQESPADTLMKGDFLVAVPVGTLPWTAATNWDGAVARANICGAPATVNNQLSMCSWFYPYGSDTLGDGTAMGTLKINVSVSCTLHG